MLMDQKKRVPLGNNGKEKRIIPYVPNFNNNTAKRTDPNVGASTWASGNQICNGKSGILAANEIKKVNHKNFWSSSLNKIPNKIS